MYCVESSVSALPLLRLKPQARASRKVNLSDVNRCTVHLKETGEIGDGSRDDLRCPLPKTNPMSVVVGRARVASKPPPLGSFCHLPQCAMRHPGMPRAANDTLMRIGSRLCHPPGGGCSSALLAHSLAGSIGPARLHHHFLFPSPVFARRSQGASSLVRSRALAQSCILCS